NSRPHKSATSRSRAWSATRDPKPGPPAARVANKAESGEGAWLSFRYRLRHFKVTRYAVRLWISESRHFGSMSICHCKGLVTTTFGIESCLAKLPYVPSGSLRATTKAEM